MKILHLLFALIFFASSQAGAVELSDIESSPYKTAINSLVGQGIVNGYDDGTYRPDQLINRAEFTKILLGTLPADACGYTSDSPTYDDVEVGSWYERYVYSAACLGVVEGYPDGSFRPANAINYAEAAKMIVNTFNTSIPQYFQEPDHWYEPFVDAVASSDGTPRAGIMPGDMLTRGEMAEMIYRLKPNAWKEAKNPSILTTTGTEISPLSVVTTRHPGQEVTGGYISSYSQWQAAIFGPSVDNYVTTQAEARSIASGVLASVNEARIAAGKSGMSYDPDLQDLAQNFAGHLVINAFYSHSDKLGKDPFDRAKEAGIEGFVAESIVWRHRDPVRAIDWWKKSAIHWNNISNSRFVRAGVGIAEEPNGGYIVVLLQGE